MYLPGAGIWLKHQIFLGHLIKQPFFFFSLSQLFYTVTWYTHTYTFPLKGSNWFIIVLHYYSLSNILFNYIIYTYKWDKYYSLNKNLLIYGKVIYKFWRIIYIFRESSPKSINLLVKFRNMRKSGPSGPTNWSDRVTLCLRILQG